MKRIAIAVAAAGLVGPGAARAAEDTSGLQVFDTNIENLQLPGSTHPHLPPLRKNWCYKGGFDYPKPALDQITARPDLVLIQQLDGKGPEGPHRQLDRLVGELEGKFGVDYNAIVAVKKPSPQPLASTQPAGCASKASQTNAVIYRTARLDYQGAGAKLPKIAFQSRGRPKGKKSADCSKPSRSSRTIGVLASFRDKLAAGKPRVNAISFHWPAGVKACPNQNVDVLSFVASRAANLTVAGGDTNVVATPQSKWIQTLIQRRFAPVQTIPKSLDYLFARKSPTVPATWVGGATTDYGSDHKAVQGFVKY